MKAIQIEAFGNPAEVLKVVDIPDVGAPAAGKVVIALDASPINQYDLLMIAGGYGYRPRLPAIMGTEGVGRVVAVGAGVKHLKEGRRTLVPFLHRPSGSKPTHPGCGRCRQATSTSLQ
jgi:NADPH:quinone reductase-like Zn-dependent oxidoreductase